MTRRSWFSMAASAMAGLSMWGVGCQQSRPLSLTVMPDQPGGARFVENKDAPYVNPLWIDVQESPDGLIGTVMEGTTVALDTMVDPVADVTTKSVRYITHDNPSAADRMVEDHTSADTRREGINKFVEFGFLHNEIFKARCRQLAERDADSTVRATAIRTANRARDPKATPLFIRGLDNPNEWIRLESAKALVNLPDVNAINPLLRVVADPTENRDVRVAAADALKHYRTLAVARGLSAMLNDKIFVIAWQSRRSLRYFTDRDFGYDAGAWLAYFTGTEKTP